MSTKARKRSKTKTKLARMLKRSTGSLPLRRAAKFNPKIMAVVAVLAVVGGSILLFGRASGPNAVVANGRFGMNTLAVMSGNDTAVSATFGQMKSIGVDWIREDLEWDGTEYARGHYDWTKDDVAVNEAVAHNVNILATIDYTPLWARSNSSSDHYPPDNPQDYANFVATLVGRYKDRVHYWEIWNEPNNPEFWLPKPNAAAYTIMLKDTYAAIKGVDPTATVISGGLAPGVSYKDPRSFLAAIYAHNGGNSTGLFDAVGWHPYCSYYLPSQTDQSWCTWYQMSGTNPSARSIMTAAGDADKLIWPTEYGVCTGGSGGQATDQATQSAALSDAYNTAAKISWLGPLFWYDLQDTSNNPGDFFLNFCGLMDYGGGLKSAWSTYKSLAVTTTDTSPPTNVALKIPVAGSTVGGSISFRATAKDNVGVTQVVVYGDGAQLGTATLTAGKYTLAWDSTAFSDGAHSFSVKAYDAAGNLTISPSITLTIDNTPPTGVAVFTPASGTVVSGKAVVFGASAQDAGTIAKVLYTIDSTVVGQATVTPYGYDYTWDSTKVANGTHTVKVRAVDAAGNFGLSPPITVVVSN